MALIVKGLNMPTCCDMCEFCIQDFDNLVAFCSASNIYWNNISDVPYDKCHPVCPLIELPPHGRLIDVDYLKEHLYQCEINGRPLHRMFTEIDELFDVIDNVPTVLEAEVEE